MIYFPDEFYWESKKPERLTSVFPWQKQMGNNAENISAFSIPSKFCIAFYSDFAKKKKKVVCGIRYLLFMNVWPSAISFATVENLKKMPLASLDLPQQNNFGHIDLKLQAAFDLLQMTE